MFIGLRMSKPEAVHWLQGGLQQGSFSRAALPRELCVRDGWRSVPGELCAPSAREVLPHLAEQLGWSMAAR